MDTVTIGEIICTVGVLFVVYTLVWGWVVLLISRYLDKLVNLTRADPPAKNIHCNI